MPGAYVQDTGLSEISDGSHPQVLERRAARVCHPGVTQSVSVGTGPVTPEDVVRVARDGAGVRLAAEAIALHGARPAPPMIDRSVKGAEHA
jgi:hypothetical protein